MTGIAELVAALPAHKASLTITHNPHKNNYETIDQYLTDRDARPRDCGGVQALDALLLGDELWEIQWYPETPIGFCFVFAATLTDAVRLAGEIT